MPAFKRFVRNMTGLETKGAAVDPDEVRPSSLYWLKLPAALSLCMPLRTRLAAAWCDRGSTTDCNDGALLSLHALC